MAGEAIAGFFTLLFGSFFLFAFLLGIIEFLGKFYATFRVFVREDLSSEQRLLYLLIVWIIPLGWLIYLLLGTERTKDLFSEVDFL